MRFDLAPVLLFLDDDGQRRPARVLSRRDGRVLVMVTRDIGMTYLGWWPADRLAASDADAGDGLGRR